MFSVTYTGMNLFPLCTARVCPTNSGVIVLRRDQGLKTFFSLPSFIARVFLSNASSTERPLFYALCHAVSRYCVAFPRLRPRTISFVLAFFLFRVFLPSGLPHGETG